jgi:hypothetical protein
MDEGNDEFGLAKYFCSYLQVIFSCCKILQHGASDFTSPLKEDVLQIFIALKNPLPWPGLNPWIKHANDYTTKATSLKADDMVMCCLVTACLIWCW